MSTSTVRDSAPTATRTNWCSHDTEIKRKETTLTLIRPKRKKRPGPVDIDTTLTDCRRRKIISDFKAPLISLPVAEHKPNPQGLLRILADFGFDPEDAIIAGDSLDHDGAVANNAGIDFVHMQHELITAHDFDVLHGKLRAPAVTQALPMLGVASRFSELLPLFG
jgi:hypothetical protein